MSPQFRYDSDPNAAAGSIADLLIRSGEIQAQRAAQVGNIQAQAAAQRGNIWGQTVSNIGQQIGSIPAQMQQAKRQGMADEVNQMKVAEMRDQKHAESVLEWALKNPNHYRPDGTPDDAKITAALRQNNVRAWQQYSALSAANQKNSLDLMKTGLEIKNSALDADKKQQAWDQARMAYLGNLALEGERLLNANPTDRLHARDTTLALVARSAADGAISEQEAKQFLMQTASAGPDQLRQVFAAFIPPELRQKAEAAQAENATKAATARRANAEAVNLEQFGRTQAPTPPAVGSFEDYTVRRFGQNPTPAQIEQARKSYAEAVPKSGMGGTGGTEGLTPEAVEYTATQYRIFGPSGIPTRIETPDRVKILNEAAKQAKELGQTPAVAVQKQAAFKADATALGQMRKMGSSAEAFESKAIQQADIVGDLSKRVIRSQWPIINRAIIAGKIELAGDTNAQLLANAITTFSTEYAKIMEGSTGSVAASTDSSRKAAERLVRVSLNKDTLQATLDLMKREMRLTIQGYDATINHITERMGGAPPPPTAPPPPPGGMPSYQDYLKAKGGK